MTASYNPLYQAKKTGHCGHCSNSQQIKPSSPCFFHFFPSSSKPEAKPSKMWLRRNIWSISRHDDSPSSPEIQLQNSPREGKKKSKFTIPCLGPLNGGWCIYLCIYFKRWPLHGVQNIWCINIYICVYHTLSGPGLDISVFNLVYRYRWKSKVLSAVLFFRVFLLQWFKKTYVSKHQIMSENEIHGWDVLHHHHTTHSSCA